ncbi:MAG TPA: hypothetical protein VJU78_21220 [Chitinophagaceae bacterium]|nr:hypothetical protein [Chitinophagaceae bacterium]
MWLAYWHIGTMSEEFIKGLSTEQLLRYIITLINEHIALEKANDNDEYVAESRALLTMISKEISARNAPIA